MISRPSAVRIRTMFLSLSSEALSRFADRNFPARYRMEKTSPEQGVLLT